MSSRSDDVPGLLPKWIHILPNLQLTEGITWWMLCPVSSSAPQSHPCVSVFFIPLYTNVFYGLQEGSFLGTKLTCLHMGVTCTHTHTHTHFIYAPNNSPSINFILRISCYNMLPEIFLLHIQWQWNKGTVRIFKGEYNQFQHTPPEY